MLRYKTETRTGLVALYDIRPGNGADLFLQPRSPHGASCTRVQHARLLWHWSNYDWIPFMTHADVNSNQSGVSQESIILINKWAVVMTVYSLCGCYYISFFSSLLLAVFLHASSSGKQQQIVIISIINELGTVTQSFPRLRISQQPANFAWLLSVLWHY